MKPLLIWYPQCSTCQKAAQWLKSNHIEFETRDIVTENPNEKELSIWMTQSKLPITRIFNTSGLRYRALNLKDRVKTAPLNELMELLASEGKLVKRPVLVLENNVLFGFKEEEWKSALNL